MKLKNITNIHHIRGFYVGLMSETGHHNTDGPARLWFDGVREWWVDNHMTKEYYPWEHPDYRET